MYIYIYIYIYVQTCLIFMYVYNNSLCTGYSDTYHVCKIILTLIVDLVMIQC